MNSTKIRIAVATAIAAVGIGAAAQTATASPKAVKVGSSGNAKLDDICRQMGDLINNEIAEGVNAEGNGDFGSANAWYAQASDHTARAQQAGCVMSIRVPKTPPRYTGPLAKIPAGTYTPAAKTDGGSKSGSGGSVRSAKKIVGSGGGGKGQLSKDSCESLGGFANTAVSNSGKAAAAGDSGAAAGWRQHANDLLAAGRKGGCTFTAV